PDSSHPGITPHGQGQPARLGVRDHRPELPDAEPTAPVPDTLLLEQDGPAVFGLDQKAQQREQWRQQHHAEARADQVESALRSRHRRCPRTTSRTASITSVTSWSLSRGFSGRLSIRWKLSYATGNAVAWQLYLSR